VHHIIPREEDDTLWYDLDNLITLSKAAHRNLHANKKRVGKSLLIRGKLMEIARVKNQVS
jgi:5-methylcytosine-specific restriction endonuclease McrA